VGKSHPYYLGCDGSIGEPRCQYSKKVKQALDKGVHITACKACADQLGVTEALEKLNIEIKYWGVPLTEILTGEEALLTI
jgi:hypothetical protein